MGHYKDSMVLIIYSCRLYRNRHNPLSPSPLSLRLIATVNTRGSSNRLYFNCFQFVIPSPLPRSLIHSYWSYNVTIFTSVPVSPPPPLTHSYWSHIITIFTSVPVTSPLPILFTPTGHISSSSSPLSLSPPPLTHSYWSYIITIFTSVPVSPPSLIHSYRSYLLAIFTSVPAPPPLPDSLLLVI